LRKNWVTKRAGRATTGNGDSCMMPSGTPATVPSTIDRTEIARLNRKPQSSSGAQRTKISGTDDLTSPAPAARTEEARNMLAMTTRAVRSVLRQPRSAPAEALRDGSGVKASR